MVWDFRTIPHTKPPYHTRFYSMPFLRLLIQFIVQGINTFGMGVWYGTVVWYGIFVPYYIPNQRTIPGFTVYQVLQYALSDATDSVYYTG